MQQVNFSQNQRGEMVNYEELIARLTERIVEKKKQEYNEKVMVVGIEGICGAGKSTLVNALTNKLRDASYPVAIIEGDFFHRGREVVHSLYKNVIELLRAEYLSVCDFHHILTWKLEELQRQVLDQIDVFNASDNPEQELVVRGVLKDKVDRTEHDEKFILTRDTIVLIPSVFLRDLKGLDLIIFLEITLETSIARKVDRTLRLGLQRDMGFTRDINAMLEYPTMLAFNKKIARQPDVIIDTNDFEKIIIKKF